MKKDGVYVSNCGKMLVILEDGIALFQNEHQSLNVKNNRAIFGMPGDYNIETDKFDDYSIVFENMDESDDDFTYLGEL